MSGGGARGFAHVGALMAIEEAGLKPDIIAAVSAGSVIAVLYAAGVPFDEMTGIFDKKGFTDFASMSMGDGGLMRIDKFKKCIMQTINKFGSYKNFEDLKIPTYVGATDIDHGCEVEFHSGPIGDRMAASCSIPIIFKPIKIEGVNYVDGGVLRNLPAWAIRKHCKTLIGLNCAPLDRGYKFKNSMIDVTLRTYSLMSKSNTLQDLELCDYVVRTPGTSRFGTFDLKALREAVRIGYDATSKVLDEALNKKK